MQASDPTIRSEAKTPALTPYDEFPYPAAAYSQSHPHRLETLARLFGLQAADSRRCRVLELAVADGANLIPMACALPESTFTGIDLAASQVKAGQKLIHELALKNIELRHLNIGQVDASFGKFDYIIAHGVYSWVPHEVQEKILAICSECLNPNGVAFVSYNTYPGWRIRGMLRDMMRYHSQKFEDPDQQVEQARALINWLSDSIDAEGNPYGMLLKSELDQMRHWQDTYFRHDSLAEINEPLYFHQFIAQAQRHGLQYLAEAEFQTMIASNYAAPVDEALNRLGRDIVELEQYMDFLRNRMFRQTLLCHRNVSLNRSLGPWSLKGLHIAAALRAENGEVDVSSTETATFRGPHNLVVSSSQPIVKAALFCLAERWPAAMPFSELVARARSLLTGKPSAIIQERVDAESDTNAIGGALLTCYSRGSCELYVNPPEFLTTPGERPRACPLTRLQAARGTAVTNRRHDRVTLDSFAKHLLPMLDGQRDRASLLDAVTALVAEGSLVVNVEGQQITEPAKVREIMAEQIERRLADFARAALLVG